MRVPIAQDSPSQAAADPAIPAGMTPAPSYALFDTGIGSCGIAWGRRGVVAIQLPERDRAATRHRLLQRAGAAREAVPPDGIGRAVRDIQALLGGEARDLSSVVLDTEGVPSFHLAVYELARAIPAGVTATYGEIARRLGLPGAARAVGQALGRNPFPIVVPCHRVLAAGGKTGGFSAHGGAVMKLRLLAIEGAPPPGGPTLFDVLVPPRVVPARPGGRI